MRSPRILLVLLLSVFCLSGVEPVPTEIRPQAIEGAKPRNVVFILSDDHRYDAMSFMGHQFARTPNMDLMAKEGVHLKNAFVTTSLCSPSRASILTGLYTFRHRVIDNQRAVPEGTVFFPQFLQQAGYSTAFIGKWHMGRGTDEPRPGFDHWVSFRGQGNYLPPSPDYTLNVNGERVPQKGYITDELTDYAVDWLEEQTDSDQPFFLYLSHKAVHANFTPAERHAGQMADAPFTPPASQADTEENYRNKPRWLRDQRNSWHGVDFPYHSDLDIEQYYKRYAEALAIAPTEIHALINRLNEAGRTGEFAVAIEAMDVILRRWSRYARDVFPAVDYFIGEPEGAVRLRSMLANEPPWRGTVISHLISSPAGIDFVQNLLLDEATKGKRQNQAELSRTIATLLRGEATDQAYRLFQLTLNDDERQVRGYVFDSAFTLTPSGKPFDWAIAKTTDVDVTFANLALAEDEQGLRVNFRNSPAKLGNISQLLKLDPGHYRLLATVTARNLDAPKGLKWMIVCRAPGATSLTQLEVLDKTYRLKELSTDFTVPPEGCPLQLLVLRTGVTTRSWRMRYNGTVIFKSIRVISNQ